MGDELVQIDRSQQGVAVVTMQRADKRNALNLALLRQLRAAIAQSGKDPACRVLILRGEGTVFCAGLDMVEANDPDVAEKSSEGVRGLISELRESPLVVIGAAVGAAYAGGAGMLAACDLVVADNNFKIGFPEVRRGMVAAIVSGVLVRKVRSGDLRELLLLAEPIAAERAQQMGLIQWIVPGNQVLDHARNVARQILAGGPTAVRETKQLLNLDVASVNFEYLQALHERVRHGAEAREGFAAFRDRREPNWCKNS